MFYDCIEFMYQKDFSQEYHEFLKQSDRCKNIMTKAKTQPFCKKYLLNLGVYKAKQKAILPRSVTERKVCFYIYNNHLCVLRKINQSTYPDPMKELEENFIQESNETADVISKKIIECKFPISYEKNCMFAVFAFDVETCNVENQLYCEAYAAGVYHPNRFNECFNGDSTEKDLEIERKNVDVFDRENNNPVLDMIDFVENKYNGKPKIVTNKYG